MKFKNGEGFSSKENLAFNRMKYNVIKDIEDIEKAIQIGNKFCRST